MKAIYVSTKKFGIAVRLFALAYIMLTVLNCILLGVLSPFLFNPIVFSLGMVSIFIYFTWLDKKPQMINRIKRKIFRLGLKIGEKVRNIDVRSGN